jgi:xanthine dehydrogenase accessory factor
MKRDIEIWQMARDNLGRDESVMLLIVAESTGSSPGRAGYKMIVAANGELAGSIGGGMMEVNLVEQSRSFLSKPGAIATGFLPGSIVEQVHQKNSPHSSGMICSGRQTVLFRMLTPDDLPLIEGIMAAAENSDRRRLAISRSAMELRHADGSETSISFELLQNDDFRYSETLGASGSLFIIGGGHCALALSEVMSRLDFRISILDDRPNLNTIEKNRFADAVNIVETYEKIGDLIPSGDEVFVVVMTVGYLSDQAVIRQLFDRDFKYFGVLGSRAKVATMFRELEDEGFDKERLSRIHAPIGVQINSRTPEEIAVSIAAEIISIRNG